MRATTQTGNVLELPDGPNAILDGIDLHWATLDGWDLKG